jgi:hypothetical protein
MSATAPHSVPLGAALQEISLGAAPDEIAASASRGFVPTASPTQPVHIPASPEVVVPVVPAYTVVRLQATNRVGTTEADDNVPVWRAQQGIVTRRSDVRRDPPKAVWLGACPLRREQKRRRRGKTNQQ